MPSLEIFDDDSDDDDDISLLGSQDGLDDLAESFEALGMQYVTLYDRSCQFQRGDSSAVRPPNQPAPPVVVVPTAPPRVPAARPIPPAAADLTEPPPVYEDDGLPEALRPYSQGVRTSKVYVVTRGFSTGVFDNW